MGNCSTTPHKNLYLRSYTVNNGGISKTAESPDLKDKDGTTTKKKLWLSPYLEEEISSDIVLIREEEEESYLQSFSHLPCVQG